METDGVWQGEADLFSDETEKQLIYSVLDSFRQLRRSAHLNTTHGRRQSFYALPQVHQEYLRKPPFSLLRTFSKVDDAIDENSDLAETIMRAGATSLGLSTKVGEDPPWVGAATKNNVDKCRSTMNQLFRDWSVEGARERQACFEPLFRDLAELLPLLKGSDSSVGPKVLVPGAGLGRLVFELYRAGYHAEGNEVSYHQLFASSYILNCTNRADEWPLYPFVMSFANHHTRSSQLRKVRVPDVHPRSATPAEGADSVGSMSMTTGDFCILYRSEDYSGRFDAVATVFFVDTAPNLIRYVETVRNCLAPGGLWINIGPLLWHSEARKGWHSDEAGTNEHQADTTQDEYRGVGEPGSFELSEDEVVMLIEDFGFEFIRHEVEAISTGYMQNPHSMLQNTYRPVHWVARKRSV